MSPDAFELVALRTGLGLAGLLLLFAIFGWWRAVTLPHRRQRAWARAGQRGEVRAEALLEEHGFEVLERQVPGSLTMWVGGEAHEVSCRADLLVRPRERRKRHRRYIAEVKTGRGGDPTLPHTRRQLLEYTMAFEVDGVLLVDMEARAVYRVAFTRDGG